MKSQLLLTAVALLRSNQWIKNAFTFSGLLFDERLYDFAKVGEAFAAFALLCAASSAGYIHNDINDLEADRLHPEKRDRPLTRGLISISAARVVQGLLAAFALGGAAMMSNEIFACVIAYMLLNLAYTHVLTLM